VNDELLFPLHAAASLTWPKSAKKPGSTATPYEKNPRVDESRVPFKLVVAAGDLSAKNSKYGGRPWAKDECDDGVKRPSE
jgi:hypothetical protein